MNRRLICLVVLVLPLSCFAQDFKVEYDKKADLTHYKTFAFGEGEITTPLDQRQVADSVLHGWIKGAIKKELTKKGLIQVDSAADLIISYMTGLLTHSDARTIGPLGMTPGSTQQSYVQDFKFSNLVIDLNDRNKKLIWRVDASTNMGGAEAPQAVSAIVGKGFKKFPKRPKDKK